MMQGFLKILFLTALTVGAFAVGYKYLAINTTVLINKEPAPEPQPVLTMQQLPTEEIMEEQVEIIEPKPVDNGDAVRDFVINHLTMSGSQVLDGKAFPTREQCDVAVKVVADEYRRRGIAETDIAETAPFPGSTGAVTILKNGANLYYIGCITPENTDWAVYVHFMPKAGG